jgi:hypothetical protein
MLASSHLAKEGLLDKDAALAMLDRLQQAVARDITTIPPLTGRLWAIVGVETWWRYVVE